MPFVILSCYVPLIHEVMDCVQKSFKLQWLCQQFLSGFLATGHLLRVSHLSANNKSHQEMEPVLCTDLIQLGDHLMKAVRPIIALNGVIYSQMAFVGRKAH